MQCEDFHRVVVRNDPVSGLRAVIAIHDVTLGPALGGVRRWVYPNQQAAIADCLALARGMTFKNAMAGLPFGGGKSVIMAPLEDGRAAPITDAQAVQFGRWIEELGGEYVAAEDVGMRVADLRHMAKATRHVTGIGRRGIGGNPGPKTAQGVLAGMAVVAERLGFASLRGVRVAVQGLGNVGMALCEGLHEAGAQLVVADIDAAKVATAQRRFAATAAPVADVLATEADIVAPCALGHAITSRLAETMRARAIAGSANNQIASDDVPAVLKSRGILYAPDYLINAGGVISAGLEYLGRPGFEQAVAQIGVRLRRVFADSEASGEPEAVVADALARATLARPRLKQVA